MAGRKFRLFPVILLTICFASFGTLYDTTHKLEKVITVNRLLANELANGDAIVELVVDTIDGSAFIRVNENSENIHIFPAACPPSGVPF